MTRIDASEVFVRDGPATPTVPLVVSVPHAGTAVPDEIAARFAGAEVAALPDTDWHVDRLYDFVPSLGGALLVACFSRYVVDLNRPADGHALYPGRAETGVVPTETFAGAPIYREGDAPDTAEIEARLDRYWRPYHAALQTELDAIRAHFGFALLWDGHSIASRVPRLFDGELPILMLGDGGGGCCDPRLRDAVLEAHGRSGLSFRPNDPFRGGYITRGFGAPERHVHALQLETSQRGYMVEGPPWAWDEARAAAFRPVLEASLRAYVDAALRLFA